MKIEETPIEGALIITPTVFSDERGSFCETFKQQALIANAIEHNFVQDNQARSKANVLRGLHFQKPPHAQGKLVRVVKGSVFDVIVDLRKSSSSFGKHFSIELSLENNKMLWVPAGLAHGYLSLTEDSIFLYKVTSYYNKQSEAGIRWDDPTLNINWKLKSEKPIVSAKDMELPFFKSLTNIF